MLSLTITALTLTFCVFLGIFTFTSNPTKKTNRLYAIFMFLTSLWIFANFTQNEQLFYGFAPILLKLDFATAAFVAFSFVYFCMNFPKPQEYNFALVAGLFVVAIIFSLSSFNNLIIKDFHFTSQHTIFTEGPLFIPYAFYFIGSIILGSAILAGKLKCSHKQERNQIFYTLIAISIPAVVAFLINLIVSQITVLPVSISRFGIYCMIIGCTIIAYAIVRFRLMDIEVIIKKGFIYSVLMAVIIGVYSFLIFFGKNVFQTTLGINQWVATIITAFVIAVGYKPLETYITNITDKYFFRKKYDYQKTLKDSSEAMNLLTDIDRLVKLTTRIVARRMELEETSTLIYDEPHHRYLVRAAEGKSRDLLGTTYSDNFELFKHLFSSKQILLKDEVVNTLNSKLVMPDERKRLTTIRKDMEKLHAQICVPSITRGKYMGNKLVAVFCMGTKKSGDMYSNEDIQLLSTLSNQAAVAVENAIMYSDLMKQFQELKETKDQLVQSEKLAALGTMAAGIAHEIRNPLTSLQLFVEMMAERFDDHEFRQKFTQIVPPEVERLNRIVNDLVSFAKPSKLIMEPAQVNDILEKTIRLSEISFKKLNVKVIKEFGPVPAVMCDQQKLMQIFLNLILNGAQSMTTGGTLTVRTYFDDLGKNVCIDIKDTGNGISEENLKKIFAPFFTTKEGGTGLGLAITKRIIDEHKGEIKIKSIVGEGTTFTVELPVASAS